MARLIFIIIVGGTALAAFLTRPKPGEYQQEIEERHAAVRASEEYTVGQTSLGMRMHNDNLLDKMVAVAPPDQLLQNTTYDDYYVVTIFTTTYQSPMGQRRLRTYGVFGSLIPFQLE